MLLIKQQQKKIFKTDRGSDWHKTYVETAAFFTDKTVDHLITEVENIFTQYLENGDKARAMKRLRVPPFEEKVRWLFISYLSHITLLGT